MKRLPLSDLSRTASFQFLDKHFWVVQPTFDNSFTRCLSTIVTISQLQLTSIQLPDQIIIQHILLYSFLFVCKEEWVESTEIVFHHFYPSALNGNFLAVLKGRFFLQIQLQTVNAKKVERKILNCLISYTCFSSEFMCLL